MVVLAGVSMRIARIIALYVMGFLLTQFYFIGDELK